MASEASVSTTIPAIDEIAFHMNLLALHTALVTGQTGETSGMARIAQAVARIQHSVRQAAGSPGESEELSVQATALCRLVDQVRR